MTNTPVNESTKGDGFDRLTRIAVVIAPAFLIAYGIARLLDGIDDEFGPGPAWSVGHLLFLAAFLAFGFAIVGLRRLAPVGTTGRRVLADAATVLGVVGVAAFVRVIVIDLIVGFRAESHGAMDRIDDQYDASPRALPAGVYDVLEDLGPLFFELGLIALLALLAFGRPRSLPRWSPVVAFLAFPPIMINLDLMPLAGALLFVALVPLLGNDTPATSVRRPGDLQAKAFSGSGARCC